MIRSALVGMWACAMTICASYIGMQWESDVVGKGKTGESTLGKMSQVRVRPLSIPVVSSAKVVGYIVCQFSYLAPAEAIKKLQVKPDIFMLDAAFNGIYTGRELDIAKLSKESWLGLAKSVKDAVNARYGSELLHEVVLEEFGYVPADKARRGQDIASHPAAEPEKRGRPH